MKSAYYNEIDPYCAEYLRNLIKAKLIPDGVVDSRSITEVQPDDVKGFAQCHFFAGIGGWAVAGRLAGWPDDREIWTGSCPCQPFSVAGKQAGNADARHLWPDFFRLIRARRPAVVVGEQVAAAIGKDWFDGVRSDLETIEYACRGVVIPACSVNAPHKRDRLWFLSARALDHADNAGLERLGRHEHDTSGWPLTDRPAAASGDGSPLAHASSSRRQQGESPATAARHGSIPASTDRANPWHDAGWIIGYDGKARRTPEPLSGIRLVAHGVLARTPKLRAAGNAIVDQVGAEILGAWLDEHPNH